MLVSGSRDGGFAVPDLQIVGPEMVDVVEPVGQPNVRRQTREPGSPSTKAEPREWRRRTRPALSRSTRRRGTGTSGRGRAWVCRPAGCETAATFPRKRIGVDSITCGPSLSGSLTSRRSATGRSARRREAAVRRTLDGPLAEPLEALGTSCWNCTYARTLPRIEYSPGRSVLPLP